LSRTSSRCHPFDKVDLFSLAGANLISGAK
jgi:hypothetical protein